MPFRTIPDTDTVYGLLSFDKRGDERVDDPDGLMSQRLIELAAGGGVNRSVMARFTGRRAHQVHR